MGRTDTEIAAEVLNLAIKISEVMARGRWPDVLEKAVTSGEIRKIMEVLGRKQHPDQQYLSTPTLPETQRQPDSTASSEPSRNENDVAPLPRGNPQEKAPPSLPDADTIRRFIAAIRPDFVKKVDWRDFEMGTRGDPADFVAHLWQSARDGNSGHVVTFLSLGDTIVFLESVGESIKKLQEVPECTKKHEVAIQVQRFLTTTDEGKRWLEAAHHTAIKIFVDKSNKGHDAVKIGTNPGKGEDDDEVLLI